jgi:aspartyl-tRNA(Asn)/glutamyl-tRNA(Gln) amidotransferase subunit A
MAETALERTDAALARSREKGETLNAFVEVMPESARATARYLDEMTASGVSLGPLHGLPIGVKDIIDVAGLPTRAGSLTRADTSPAANDATVVARLRAAGAVIVAKTNTVEYAFGGWGTNANIGAPRNPWRPDVPSTCGGSSSGTGAAVGGGVLPAGLGSDTGGSVRIPAALCGCVGLKTSIGLVSRAGVVPLSDTLDTVGPLTDTVRRAAEMLDVMQGEDRADPTTVGIARRDPLADLERGITGFRLGAVPVGELPGLTDAVAADYEAAKQTLADLGASVSDASLPLSLQEYQNRSSLISAGDAYAFHAHLADDPEAPLNAPTRKRMLVGKALTGKDRIRAQREREQAISDFLAWLDRYDALILPSVPLTAIPLAEVDEDNYIVSLYTRLANYLALTGLSVPMGLSPTGLPTSLQIVARRFDDPLALRIGHAYETARGTLS